MMNARLLSFHLMRKITSKPVMDFLVRRKVNALGQIPISNGGSMLIRSGNEHFHATKLNNDGFTILDNPISTSLLEEIVAYSEKIRCYDAYNDPDKPIDVKHPPANTHVAHYKRNELVQFKPIFDLANDPGILTVVQDFLGAKPTISNVNMWWSFAGRKQAEHAQLFHRDLDDWKFCKLFVYLTDVDHKSGPHIYVKGSAQSPRLRKIRRYSDGEVERVFGKDSVMSFTAPKGTAFLVNTYGFHKGLLPEGKDRLLLQIQYSLSPIAVESYAPAKGDLFGHNSYINRLLKTRE